MIAEARTDTAAPVWRAYLEDRTDANRNAVVECYLPLVDAIARTVTLAATTVGLDDLRQWGSMGLMQAVERYDLSRNVRFQTYACRRIHGAMMDNLRQWDPIPRTRRQKQRRLSEAHEAILQDGGDPEDIRDLAKALGITQKKARQLAKAALTPGLTSLELPLYQEDDGTNARLGDVYQDDTESTRPEETIHRMDVWKLVASKLTRERGLIVLLYYYAGLTMKTVGCATDFSESRISQLHKLAVAELRAKLGDRRDEFVCRAPSGNVLFGR